MPERILTVAEMRDWEARTWAAGVSPDAVIHRAGREVARAVRQATTPGCPVLVLAGRGHNGDDAAVAAADLSDRIVTLVRAGEPEQDGRAHEWLVAHRDTPGAWVVDGLFGIGLSRPLEGAWADLVRSVNFSRLPVLAVDVPSGLDADTGEVHGVAIEAATTVTLGAVKRGLVNEAAARFVGRLELARDIGLLEGGRPPEAPSETRFWTLPEDFRGFPPRRPSSAHKGTFGHLVILAGSEGYHGAGVLAASGALRARPGLVTLFTDERCYVPVASQLEAAMVRPWRGEPLDSLAPTAILLGPGLASPRVPPTLRAEVERVWLQALCPVVADATALDWLPRAPLPDARLRLITPHPGEAARLLETTVPRIQSDRAAAARRLASLWPGSGMLVVLKGRMTIVTRGSDGPCLLNSTGNPGLAQGGSGDVLAGYLGGFLAQPELASHPLRTTCLAVWRHGLAADNLESKGLDWTMIDLVAELGRVSARGHDRFDAIRSPICT